MTLKIAPRNVVCEGFDDSVILPPGAVMTGNHEMYKVFTPFKNAWLKPAAEGCRSASLHGALQQRIDKARAIHYAELSSRQSFDTAHFPVEEKAAIAQLRQFCQNGAG